MKKSKPCLRGDMVNRPPHYTAGGIECIDAIEAALSSEEFVGYCKGNVLKYTWRSGLKSKSPTEDMKKAEFYLKLVISRLENPPTYGKDPKENS